MATEKQKTRARKAFDRACKETSKCRHERFQISCMSCKDTATCEIYGRTKTNLEIIKS